MENIVQHTDTILRRIASNAGTNFRHKWTRPWFCSCTLLERTRQWLREYLEDQSVQLDILEEAGSSRAGQRLNTSLGRSLVRS